MAGDEKAVEGAENRRRLECGRRRAGLRRVRRVSRVFRATHQGAPQSESEGELPGTSGDGILPAVHRGLRHATRRSTADREEPAARRPLEHGHAQQMDCRRRR